MRTLLAVLVAFLIGGCVSAPPKAVAPVAPVQVIGVFKCGVFEGAVVVMPDGTTSGHPAVELPSVQAAVKAMPHPPYAVQLNDGCAPHQST